MAGLFGAMAGRAGEIFGAGIARTGYGHVGSELTGAFRGSVLKGYRAIGGSRALGRGLKSMRNHAIVGAGLGGVNAYRRGDSVSAGMVRGAVLGGAIGGVRMGYKAMNRIQGTGAYSTFLSEARNFPKDTFRRR